MTSPVFRYTLSTDYMCMHDRRTEKTDDTDFSLKSMLVRFQDV